MRRLQAHIHRKGQLNMRSALGLLIGCVLLAGCDADRVTKLEKENADLKTKIDRQNAAVDYDLQAKCSKDARSWFNGNWSRDKDTFFLDFSNHYNIKQNKCFIIVEFHFNSHMAGPDGDSWTDEQTLYDIYENSKYGEFTKNYLTHYKPKYTSEEGVTTCEVYGAKCKTNDEFNNLTRPYMND